MNRKTCGSCDGLIDDDGTCDCDPAYVADVALLRRALAALEQQNVAGFSATIAALRERLGEKA